VALFRELHSDDVGDEGMTSDDEEVDSGRGRRLVTGSGRLVVDLKKKKKYLVETTNIPIHFN
jgi:hypothetical protein